jgi:translation initiation factor 4B
LETAAKRKRKRSRRMATEGAGEFAASADEPKLERQPRERHPSWRSEETQEWKDCGQEVSYHRLDPLPHLAEVSQTRMHEGESAKSLENETLNKEEDCHSPASKPPKPDQPLKVMPAPPPKENAWVKRSFKPPARSQSSDTEQQSPTSGVGKGAPVQTSEEGPARKDDNKIRCMSVSKGQTGNSSRVPGDQGTKTSGKSQIGTMAKRIKTPDLHLSQRNLRKIQ